MHLWAFAAVERCKLTLPFISQQINSSFPFPAETLSRFISRSSIFLSTGFEAEMLCLILHDCDYQVLSYLRDVIQILFCGNFWWVQIFYGQVTAAQIISWKIEFYVVMQLSFTLSVKVTCQISFSREQVHFYWCELENVFCLTILKSTVNIT